MTSASTPPPPCALTDPSALSRYCIDDRVPDFVAAPDSEEACAELMRWAVRERVALVPVGGATELRVGNLLQSDAWCAVSTARLSGVVDYSPADLTVIARAGATLAELDALLGASGQWLPYDVPDPHRATIGGLLATNRQGMLRSAFGSPRDRTLGLRVALANGTVVRTGGRTVKNVAGYDLTKLFAGSRGTLGLITEVTIRTAAVPPVREELAFRAPDVRSAATAAASVLLARLDPLKLAVTGPKSPSIHVVLSGNAERVAWQKAAVTEVVTAFGLSAAAADAADIGRVDACPIRARCAILASAVAVFLDSLGGQSESFEADAASGTVDVGFGDRTDAATAMAALRGALPEPGWAFWTDLPATAKRDLDVWFPAPESIGVMRCLKRALDPDRIFSPGRFAGRL